MSSHYENEMQASSVLPRRHTGAMLDVLIEWQRLRQNNENDSYNVTKEGSVVQPVDSVERDGIVVNIGVITNGGVGMRNDEMREETANVGSDRVIKESVKMYCDVTIQDSVIVNKDITKKETVIVVKDVIRENGNKAHDSIIESVKNVAAKMNRKNVDDKDLISHSNVDAVEDYVNNISSMTSKKMKAKLTESHGAIEMTGDSLTVAKLVYLSSSCRRDDDLMRSTRRLVFFSDVTTSRLRKNAEFLRQQISEGHVIYGVNTGYGGSADIRSSREGDMQTALISHLNAGFGAHLDAVIVRASMITRVNALCRAYSGVRPELVTLLCGLINNDITPVVPLRGSVSASGDLMPLSYVAALMMGRKDARVIAQGKEMLAEEALLKGGLNAVEFKAKEALAIINGSSVAAAYATRVLFDSTAAILLTQAITAMCVEGLNGKMESFHDTVHQCLPHEGNKEVAQNIRSLLRASKFVQHCLEWKDRYALRTAAQWLGPAVETWSESHRRVTVELNSTGDNPLIDHERQNILHGGNFQGISITVAMDQLRQSLQLCGRLVFAQLSELINHLSGHGLPPNLSGTDFRTDFGFKGVDTATASYQSELDLLNTPLSGHVHSAEMHNQSVNSMALVSARVTSTALDLLQMILTNALGALCQAVELRWLREQVLKRCRVLLRESNIPIHDSSSYSKDSSAAGTNVISSSEASAITAAVATLLRNQQWLGPAAVAFIAASVTWYELAFTFRRPTISRPMDCSSDKQGSSCITSRDHTSGSGVKRDDTKDDKNCGLIEEFFLDMETLTSGVRQGDHLVDISSNLGAGTRTLYLYVRQLLRIPFHDGSSPLDSSLDAIYNSIKERKIYDVIIKIFKLSDGVDNGSTVSP